LVVECIQSGFIMASKLKTFAEQYLVWILAFMIAGGIVGMIKTYRDSHLHEYRIVKIEQEHDKEMIEVQNNVTVLHTRITKLADELKNFQINHISTHNMNQPRFRGSGQ